MNVFSLILRLLRCKSGFPFGTQGPERCLWLIVSDTAIHGIVDISCLKSLQSETDTK